MPCRFIEGQFKSAAENMQLDSSLLENLKNEEDLILHFYGWKQSSATFGHFIDPEDHLNLEAVNKWEIDLAKRPTGGGIIFHLTDLAFSVLVPATSPFFTTNTLQNYAFINSKVKKAIEKMFSSNLDLLKEEKTPLDASCRHFCMAGPTKYDVMYGMKKIGGAAQRMTKFGYLHQGSIFLGGISSNLLEELLKKGTRVIEAMEYNSFPLLGENYSPPQLKEARQELKSHLKNVFNEEL